MKFSLSWLKEHLETESAAGTIADTLTRIGLEVEQLDDPAATLREWGPHLIGVALVLGWLHHVALPLGTYALCFVLPGQAASLLRGFAEHRADAPGPSRAATVVSRGPLALLFLNNNLPAAHHAVPAAPWYRLPAIERARTQRTEPRYAGYREIWRRFALRPHDAVRHPALREGAHG